VLGIPDDSSFAKHPDKVAPAITKIIKKTRIESERMTRAKVCPFSMIRLIVSHQKLLLLPFS